MDKIIIGNVDWLRNDYRNNITVAGITYPTLEHAYQACKFSDRNLRQQIADTESVREARRLGKSKVQSHDFDREQTMEILLRRKFSDDLLGKQLAETKTANLIMEGYDEFWGTGNSGDGENMLGFILEKIRSELQVLHGTDLSCSCGPYEGCCGCSGDEIPKLKDAILNAADEDLALACQKLFDSSKAILTTLDQNDYDAEYISSKTGRPVEQIKETIDKLNVFTSSLSELESLLESEEDEDYEDDNEDDFNGWAD